MRHATATKTAAQFWTPRSALTVVSRPRVVTWLGLRDRIRLDAATTDQLTVLHVDALPEVLGAITSGQADAVLLSAARIQPSAVPLLTRLVRGFPATPVAGFIGENDDASGAITGALRLGQAGVTTVLDCRSPSGWAALRSTFSPRHMPDAFLRACVALTLGEIDGQAGAACSDGLARFFSLVFTPDVTSAKLVGVHLGVRSCTLMSRFYRAGLPSPKRYLAMARLVWAAHLAESPGLSISTIAGRLDASSPQSFHRSLRLLTGRTAAEFRRTVTGATMFDQFCATLVAPHREALRTFDPVGITIAATRPRSAPAHCAPCPVQDVAHATPSGAPTHVEAGITAHARAGRGRAA